MKPMVSLRFLMTRIMPYFGFTCLLVVLSLIANLTFAQSIRTDGSSHGNARTAVPFLLIAPDARSAGMGDVGVATAPDAFAMHRNAARYVLAEDHAGVGVGFTPWLRRLASDISLSYLAGYAKLSDRQVVAASLKYFSLGEVRFADGQGTEYLQYRPFEGMADAAYALRLAEGMGLSTTFRYVYSGIGAGDYLIGEAYPGHAFAFDVGWYYRRHILSPRGDADLSFGAQLANAGTRMQYGLQRNYLPTDLRIGAAYARHLDTEGRIALALDLCKLLVPAERDAQAGLAEELRDVRVSAGVEWAPGKPFALRCGYYHSSSQQDNLRYFTAGLGLRYEALSFDFAYLLSTQPHHPLQSTMRFALAYGW